MKDIIISGGRQRNEITILVLCFLCAVGLNAYSIITFNTSWIELFSQIGWTMVITMVFYAAIIVLRIIFYLLRRVFGRKRRR